MSRHRPRVAIKRALAALESESPASGASLLIYHRVGGASASEVDLDVDAFDRQMAHLAEHAQVVTLDDAVRRLAGGAGDDTYLLDPGGTNTCVSVEHDPEAVCSAP